MAFIVSSGVNYCVSVVFLVSLNSSPRSGVCWSCSWGRKVGSVVGLSTEP
ncbi:hypothetical protein OC707_01495 ['Opuntia sp.' phytoplasma]|uniref:Uncharacterized protein n=1 Tax=Candidatus Phytoplasma asiaticum TaxID=2763338 RepID=A0AAX3B8L3_9MOLU|nr:MULTISPECIES: hypothetical protein [Phytoplasma]MDO8054123.1 hypothetical protein ['Opuntia sp.' phytoplasma]MDO8057969.1 hypothetical protein ['Opuntia sp.' phytoplasma]UQV27012.1 hypothetical protein H7686_0001420 ['Parthenium hysterophorus' phyllody phytoplasma]